MKKTILVMLCMIFAICQAYAQSEVTDSLSAEAATQSEVTDSLSAEVAEAEVLPVSLGDISPLAADLNARLKKMTFDPDQKIFVPIHGKTKFAKHHYIYQTVEISTMAGKDADRDSDQDQSGDQGPGSASGLKVPDLIANLNLGLNIGYSLIFVPGKIEEKKLRINKLGFAYGTGLIAAFDRQEKYGVTCDFLLKTSVEVGNGHLLGMGFDALIGSGKAGNIFYTVNEDGSLSEPSYESTWCFKYGSQMWIKTNLLSTSIKNSDLLIFARFVESVNPYDDMKLWEEDKIINQWVEESWQFGITFRYRF